MATFLLLTQAGTNNRSTQDPWGPALSYRTQHQSSSFSGLPNPWVSHHLPSLSATGGSGRGRSCSRAQGEG